MSKQEKGWDPVLGRYLPIVDRTKADMSWLGKPMTDREAAEYEIKRAAIIAAQEATKP